MWGARRIGLRLGAVLGLCCALGWAGAARGGAEFRLVDLGVLDGGNSSGAYALNDVGNSTGWANQASVSQVFLSDGQPPMRLVAVPGSGTGYAINGFSQIAGTTLMTDSTGRMVTRGFVTGKDGGAGTPLSGLVGGVDYSDARAINLGGVIAGAAKTSTGALHAAMWDDPTASARDLGTLAGGSQSQVLGINDAKVMVGWSETSTVRRAAQFVYDGSTTTVTDLGALTLGGQSMATAINATGLVVGSSSAAGGYTHAFLFDARNAVTPMIDIQSASHAWDGWSSEAHGINGSNWVVGQLWRGDQHLAFLWVPGLGMRSLADLIDPSDLQGWVLTDARGVNAAGQIVGIGVYQGRSRAFLLAPTNLPPVPEPASLGLLGLGLGLAALAAAARRRARAG